MSLQLFVGNAPIGVKKRHPAAIGNPFTVLLSECAFHFVKIIIRKFFTRRAKAITDRFSHQCGTDKPSEARFCTIAHIRIMPQDSLSGFKLLTSLLGIKKRVQSRKALRRSQHSCKFVDTPRLRRLQPFKS